ncbi:type VI secretion system tube protein Hcp [Deltaproteobacteria bacterium Smac51]|nr:type VI secretion system tube protein Hcp [Deltaproteobacteria bacterium Smac51]
MPTPAYLSIQGERQGNITAGNFTEDSVGNIWQEGHEDETLIEAFEHQIVLPRDPQSGQPTGQRVHKPFKVTKVMDKCSPLLFRSLTSGEKLPEVKMKFYRTSAQGTMEHYYTITLEDAIIVDITSYFPNCQDPGMAHFTHLEDVYFTYRKITKTHEVASTSESDDWRTMSQA